MTDILPVTTRRTVHGRTFTGETAPADGALWGKAIRESAQILHKLTPAGEFYRINITGDPIRLNRNPNNDIHLVEFNYFVVALRDQRHRHRHNDDLLKAIEDLATVLFERYKSERDNGSE